MPSARAAAERSGRARAVPHERAAADARAGSNPEQLDDGAESGGLVTCAKTGRAPHADPTTTDPVAVLWNPAFPEPHGVTDAAKLLKSRGSWSGHEGPRPRIVVGPGCIALENRDLAKAERRKERARERHDKDIAAMVRQTLATGELPDIPAPTREVTSWSRKSRARMVRTLCELDYTPLVGGTSSRLPGMLTLTYPGDWLTVAPTGKAAKRHLDVFRKRYERAWGEPLAYIWKLEFQYRGAPHFHLLMRPPHGRSHDGHGLPFRQWVSKTWADVVAHPDPQQRRMHENSGTRVDYHEGLRARDPKRVAVYFTKHGTFGAKGYQHRVPEAWQAPGKGPGRFWGYRSLNRAVDAAEISQDDYTWLARLLRRHARAQGVTHQVTITRSRKDAGDGDGGTTGRRRRRRRVRRRVARFGGGQRSGFVSVNNGPALAADLARALRLDH